MTLPTHVSLLEVGPRDGLQNISQAVAASVKIELVHQLMDAGLRHIEVTGFVSPKWVPQMADHSAVMAGIERREGVRLSVLTPNLQGLEGALQAGAHEVVVFTSVSESFNQKNINCSVAQSIERLAPVVERARSAGVHVRASISCALGCPYEGEIAPSRVADLAGCLRELGVQHLGVADTIGTGTPHKVQRAMEAALRHFDLYTLSGHFHDTYGQALANILASMQMGVWQFDTSVAGLGGCPFAPGASGNAATEDVVYLLHGMGIDTGIDLDRLVDAGQFICKHLGQKPHSRCANALLARRSTKI